MNGVSVQMLFNPQAASLEQLEKTLTSSRRDMAELIMGQVRGDVETGGSHNNLFIGPRGTGKTHLLHFIRRTLVERLYPEGEQLIVAAFSEEERGVVSFFHFLVSCLRAAGVKQEEMTLRLQKHTPEMALEAARDLFAERLSGKPVLIILENLDNIFGGLDHNALTQLRGHLSEFPNVSLLASSISLFSDSARPDHPFYGYFEIHSMTYMGVKETREFLSLLARTGGDQELYNYIQTRTGRSRVKAIHHLTGGNHRLLAMLANFLDAEGLADLVNPFIQMVDRELTPYYQQRLDRLSPQQQAIVQAIADQHGRAIIVKDIAQITFMEPGSVGRQLHDLKSGGYVRAHPRGRETHYELREPLLRLVLDIKDGRDRPLRTIVELLGTWFRVKELKSLGAMASDDIKPYYEEALQFRLEKFKGTNNKALVKGTSVEISVLEKFFKTPQGRKIALYIESKDYQNALALTEISLKSNTDIQDVLILVKAEQLFKLNEYLPALSIYSEFLNRFGESEKPGMPELIAKSLFNQGVVFGCLGLIEDEINTYIEIVRKFGECAQSEIQFIVANSLYNQGVIYEQLGRLEEALSVYSEVVRCFQSQKHPELFSRVTWALYNQGVVLAKLGRIKDELHKYSEVEQRVGNNEHLEIQEVLAKTLYNRGVALAHIGLPTEALAAYFGVEKRFGNSEHLEIQIHLGMALLNIGVLLTQLGRPQKALFIYSNIIQRFEHSNQQELQILVAKALINKGTVFSDMGNNIDSIAMYYEAVRRYGDSSVSKLQAQVAKALFNNGVVLGKQGSVNEAHSSYLKLVEMFGESDHPEFLEPVAKALLNIGVLLGRRGKVAEVVVVFKKLLDKFALIQNDEVQSTINRSFAFSFNCFKGDNRLREIVDLYRPYPRVIHNGLIHWLKIESPLDDNSTKALEPAEVILREELADVPDVKQALDMLRAARLHALGDDRALLEIPVELRRLIAPEDDETSDDDDESPSS